MLTPTQLLFEFESLGDSSEFGVVQHHYGANPFGLLRWSGAKSLDTLLGALEARFAGLGDPRNVEVQLLDGWKRYALVDKRFGFYFHTDNVPEPGRDINSDRNRIEFVSRPLRELRDRLVGQLDSAQKVFVYRRKDLPTAPDIARLFAAIRRYAPDNALLWVSEGAKENWGKVKLAVPGLALGYVDRLADQEPPRVSAGLWLEICTAAFTHLRGGQPREAVPPAPPLPVLFRSGLLGGWQS